MVDVSKKFRGDNGESLIMNFRRKGNSIITNAAVKRNGIVETRNALHSVSAFKSIYPTLKDYKSCLFFFESLGEKKNPQEKDDWKALRNIAAPKEGPDETYIFDEKSSGIYTPVLEGIARANPRRMSSDGYLNLSEDEHKLFMKEKDSLRELQAYRHIFKAYRLADIACHVAYYHNARKEKGLSGSDKEVVEKLMYFHDPKSTEWRDSLIKEKFEYEQYLKENNKLNLIQKVKAEFKLEEKPKTIIKKPVKIPLTDSLRDDEESLESVNETIEILENSLRSKYKKHPEDIKKIDHFLVVEKKKQEKLLRDIEQKNEKLKKL